jgi:hypothetical protein
MNRNSTAASTTLGVNRCRRGELTSGSWRDAASALRKFENRAAGVPIRGGPVSTMAVG